MSSGATCSAGRAKKDWGSAGRTWWLLASRSGGAANANKYRDLVKWYSKLVCSQELELHETHYALLQSLFDEIEVNQRLRQQLSSVCSEEVCNIDEVMAVVKGYGYEFYSFEDLPVSDMICKFVHVCADGFYLAGRKLAVQMADWRGKEVSTATLQAMIRDFLPQHDELQEVLRNIIARPDSLRLVKLANTRQPDAQSALLLSTLIERLKIIYSAKTVEAADRLLCGMLSLPVLH